MQCATMMNDHRASRNGANFCRTRIQALVAFNRVCLRGSAVKSMRKDSQQMGTGYICHGTVFNRAISNGNPEADLLLVIARIVVRFILVPWGRPTNSAWFKDSII